MAILRGEKEKELARGSGRRLAGVLQELKKMVKPGLSVDELDSRGFDLIKEAGDEPSFLNYMPEGARRPYPSSVCVSVNDEIVHGVSTENPHVLEEGDIVTIDLGLIHEGLYTDAALTVPVGEISKEARHLIHATRTALEAGIAAARAGNHVGDIGYAIESVARKEDVNVFRELVGHGVGHSVHEEPYVPNYGQKGEGEELVPGMMLAIEPMFGLGSSRITLKKDGFTYATHDGSLAAHFEHTILITRDKAEILTLPQA